MIQANSVAPVPWVFETNLQMSNLWLQRLENGQRSEVLISLASGLSMNTFFRYNMDYIAAVIICIYAFNCKDLFIRSHKVYPPPHSLRKNGTFHTAKIERKVGKIYMCSVIGKICQIPAINVSIIVKVIFTQRVVLVGTNIVVG